MTRAKGPTHKVLPANDKDVRDGWPQPGEKGDERTLRKLHGNQGRFPSATWRIDFNLAQDNSDRKRLRVLSATHTSPRLPLCSFYSHLGARSPLPWQCHRACPQVQPTGGRQALDELAVPGGQQRTCALSPCSGPPAAILPDAGACDGTVLDSVHMSLPSEFHLHIPLPLLSPQACPGAPSSASRSHPHSQLTSLCMRY